MTPMQVEKYSLDESLTCILTHLLNLFTAPPRAHGPRVAVVILLLFDLDVGAVAVYYDGAARLSAAQARPWVQCGVLHLRIADARGRRGGRHVVRIRCSTVVVLGSSRVGGDGDLRMLRHCQNAAEVEFCGWTGCQVYKRRLTRPRWMGG
jgi:hypothetical protein